MDQPDFAVLSAALTGVAHQFSLIPNVPVMNQGALLAAQVQKIQQQQQQIQQQLQQQQQQLLQLLDNRFQRLETRLDASEKNSIARLSNATISNTQSPLSPIYTKDDQVADGFPEALADLDGLNGNSLTALLNAYDQPSSGNIAAKRKRFKRFIGIVVDLGL